MRKRYIVMRVDGSNVTYWNGTGWGDRSRALLLSQNDARTVARAYTGTSLVEIN